MIPAFDLKNRLISLLVSRKGQFAPSNPELDKLDHSLQCAWRAQQAGEPADYVVMALFHDVFGGFHESWHGAMVGRVLWPYISHRAQSAVTYHERAMKEIRSVGLDWVLADLRDSETDRFFAARYDFPSFDPEYKTPVLAHFYPLIDEVIHD